MVANLIPQIKDRTNEVKRGELSGKDRDKETARLKDYVTQLKERVGKLPEDQTRTDYLQNVEKLFGELESARDESEDKKPEEKKEEEPKTPETPESKPVDPEPVKDKDPEPVKPGKKAKS